MAACGPLIRPPFLRYSSVSRQMTTSASSRRASTARATSSAGVPPAASSAASTARRPWPIDALCESTSWISRSGSRSRATWALLNVPDRVEPTVTQTIASAPPAKIASNVSLNVPGLDAAVVGNGASGATIRSQNASEVRSTPAR